MKRLYKLLPVLLLLLSSCQKEVLVETAPSSSSDIVDLRDAAVFPDIIPLPDGFQPEGIVVGGGTSFYAGSLLDGSIVKGDLRTGALETLVSSPPNRITVGLSYDARSNYVFTAGGFFGNGFIYDGDTGEEIAGYAFASGFTFVNDVIVTREAAYFTDSFRPVLYKVALGPGGSPASGFEEIPLSGEFEFDGSGTFPINSNGIEATPDGRYLILVNTRFQSLYRVDPDTGETVEIDLGGGSVPNGDGLLLAGKTLYVVQNFINQVAVVELDSDYNSGSIVNTITSPDFRIPTTADRFGSSLYVVNARFNVPNPGPNTEYEVVRVQQ